MDYSKQFSQKTSFDKLNLFAYFTKCLFNENFGQMKILKIIF